MDPFEKTVRLAPFNPTCNQAQEISLKLLKLQGDDVLFDLGCGDGRVLLAAASHTPGLRCVGVELDPVHAAKARQAIGEAPSDVAKRIQIRQSDVMEELGKVRKSEEGLCFLEDSTALFVYLLPKGLEAVKPILDSRREVAKRFRVVSYMFSIPQWKPVSVHRTTKGECPIYLYEWKS